MTFNWDNIKYLFQVPLSWFKAVHDYLFGAYGTNFIVVKQDQDGAMQIDVDADAFAQAVANVAPGEVKSVDGILPDANGNVELSGYVTSVDGIAPDLSGAVSFGLDANMWVKTDADGHLTTTYTETPIAIDTSQFTPVTTSNPKKVITGVSWNGTILSYSSENWTFQNGVLVLVTSNADTTIDTPVQY